MFFEMKISMCQRFKVKIRNLSPLKVRQDIRNIYRIYLSEKSFLFRKFHNNLIILYYFAVNQPTGFYNFGNYFTNSRRAVSSKFACFLLSCFQRVALSISSSVFSLSISQMKVSHLHRKKI